MKMSTMFGATLRAAPGNTEAEGHQLLLRAGMVRQLAQGIFSFLPLGWRSMRKIEGILRAEMDAIGGQEVSMPVVNPAEAWQPSGRYDKVGPELARFCDRRGRDMVLAMTHEEIVTGLAGSEISSYRDLPRMVYQIQTKFRDDARPRAGLVRVREFLMKDAYTFDTTAEGLTEQYIKQYQAYRNIFQRCGLPVLAVAADVGVMGGSLAHEYMYATPIGEDTLLLCDGCGYSANRQVARFGKGSPPAEVPLPLAEFATPGARTIDDLVTGHEIPADRTAKAIFLAATHRVPGGQEATEFVVAIVRGDMELNETKLANAVDADDLRPMTADEIDQIGAVAGYGSPIGVTGATVVVDDLAAASANLVAGANREGFHLRNVNCGRDYAPDVVADITAARDGDPCIECAAALRATRGVEVGNIFQLGDRYSAAYGATFLDADGRRRPVLMGCYGIGVGRLLACVAEEHRDAHGLRLPITVAPYQVHLCQLDGPGTRCAQVAERIYRQLWAAGVEVLHDDRGERPGVQFADADLIGLPIRLVVGRRGLDRGGVEVRDRQTGDTSLVAADEVAPQVRRRVTALFDDIAATVVPAELPAELRPR